MPVHQTPISDILAWREAATPFHFIDVRTAWEWEAAHIEGSTLLTPEGVAAIEALPRSTRLAFLCHHGIRSDAAAHHFARLGFTDVHNIIGGIDAWSAIDPAVPRY